MLGQVLGVTKAGLDEGVIQRLIADKREEDQWLDFKSELPSKDADGYREFGKDVSAFANALGGLIIYGVKDKDSRAEAPTPVGLRAQVDRLSRVLRSQLSPHVRGVKFHEIEQGNSGLGFLVLEISRSHLGPHLLVDEQKYFGYWRRVQRDSVLMTEPEVERAYRDKFELRQQARAALDKDAQRASAWAAPSGCVWFTALPLEPQPRIWSAPADAMSRLHDILDSPSARGPLGRLPFVDRLSVRFRSLEQTWKDPENPIWRGRFTLSDLGQLSRVVAFRPTGTLRTIGGGQAAPAADSFMTSEGLFEAILSPLVLLKVLAQPFGISSPLVVRAGISKASPIEELFLYRGSGFVSDHRKIQENHVDTETVVDIDDLFDASRLMICARSLLGDLQTAFGIGDVREISSDGALHSSAFGPDVSSSNSILEWARSNGVRVV